MSDETLVSNIRIVKAPAGSDLEFVRMTGKEELGRLFEFELEVQTLNADLQFKDFINETLTIEVSSDGGAHRFFNGYVSRFSYVGTSHRYSVYHLSLRPWLWFLTRTADCRVFQDRTVPEILDEVFGENDLADFETALDEKDYRRWEYLVQYRETSFDFLSRLMEQEGIYYFFRHEKERHVLVLADSLVAHQEAPVHDYGAPGAIGEDRRFSHWRFEHQPQSTSYAATDFDFRNPLLDLEVRSQAGSAPPSWHHEFFDYPGEFRDLSEGEAHVRARLEEIESRSERVTCRGTVPGLEAGAIFKLNGHPRSDQNREYLVVSAEHDLRWHPHFAAESAKRAESAESGEPAESEPYASKIEAIPSSFPFRPPLLTPNAVVRGPQTAIVVGPEDQKIHTDEYGRVKVRFHWDRRGKKDGNDSCWIRVSQGRAGNHWGAMQLPHVGQEVIVEFLEGDPDRPIITGSVYNAANMPPLKLPENRFRTVVARDHYGNAIIFDGTPGDEHIGIHSPHHNSGLVLGRSLGGSTASNDYSFAVGTKVEAHIGASLSVKLGAKADIDIAPGVAVQVGHRRDFQLGRVKTVTMRDRAADCHEDYVIQVHGQKGKMSVSADDDDKKATKRSMLYLDRERVELTHGGNVPQSGEGGFGPLHVSAEATLYAALGLALLTRSRLGWWEQLHSSRPSSPCSPLIR
jgi:type VI secretion system secreted protein VgrG